MLALLLRSLLGSLVAVQAYVPARSVNETTLLNTTDQTSSIDFVWVQGTYHATLSLQLVADPNTSDFFPNPYAVDGIDRGALVHFSEDNARNNDTATTPWIAFISCDRNVTDASLDIDVFTLARDRGANAALLYSITSVGCMIEPEFRNDYEKPLNVFTTRSRSDAVLIESQFQYTTNAFYEFYAPLLNASYQSVTTLLNRTYPEASTYVCAVLAMSNATGTVGNIVPTATAGVPANGAGDGGGGGGGNKGTSLAMIILYAIAGVIIIIVAVVIYMGAMRAARNPDRYGPRAAGGGQARGYPYNYDDEDAFDDAFATRMGYATGGQTGQHLPAQTRTQGLARAIVDSFPLVKFARRDQRADGGTRREEIDGQQRPAPLGNEGTQRPRVERADESSKGSYLSGGEVESLPLEPMYRRSLRDDKRSATEDDTKSSQAAQVEVLDASPSGSTHYRRTSADGLTAAPIDTRSIGSAMGDEPNLALEETEEHCPICLLDFEDGDDMRVLPCEGSHQFHAVCIDQWLLEISSSCPLCREDFSLLDTSSTTSLPLADSGQTTPPSGSAVSANVAPAAAPTAAAPSRTRIQGFLRRVRSTQVRPGQPPAASSSRGQRRPSNAETAARQHSIALNSAALF